MPYIPPPRPPVIPKPPSIPVHRPPQHNFHMQNQQRMQQQQRMFHQQQQQRVFQQNQQQRMFHQQQQQRVLQQNLRQQEMHRQQQDRLRREDQHRRDDQLRRQQQQIQQDNLRRQQQLQQDHLRRQQQFHQQQVHQSQQSHQTQLLRNMQSSNDLNGPTVVHISPGINFGWSGDASGFRFSGDGFTFSGGGAPPAGSRFSDSQEIFQAFFQSNAQPPPAQQQATPTAPPTTLPQQQATPTAPPPQGARPTGPPPPYPGFAPPPGVHPKAEYTQSSPALLSPPPLPPLVGREDNRILLADGTQIVLQQEDEILFIGPAGQRMVVNCLPLYEPPSDDLVAKSKVSHVQRSHTVHTRHSPCPLKKAKSEEVLSEPTNPKKETAARSSEAEDINSRELQRGPVTLESAQALAPSGKGVSPDGSSAAEQTASTSAVGGGEGVQEGEGEREGRVTGGEQVEATDNASGSDEEDGETQLSVKYEEQFKPTLKRSSGSVSFISGISTLPYQRPVEPPVVEDALGHRPEQNGVSAQGRQTAGEPLEKADVQAMPTLAGSGDDSTEQNKDDVIPCPEGKEDGASPAVPEEREGQPNSGSGQNGGASPGEEGGGASPGEEGGGASPGEKEGGVSPGEKEGAAGKGSGEESVASPGTGEKSDISPSSGFGKPPLLVEASNQLTQPDDTPTAPPSPPVVTPVPPAPSPRTPTPLPAPPSTIEPGYMDRSGWLTKLSHRKGMFGDKWQKRYFVLHGSWLYYFKKYGDANPRGAIRILPGGWSKPVPQGTPRMADAVASTTKGAKIISILRCLCVHRPSNHAASLSALLSNEGVAEAFRSQTVSVTNPQFNSRTFYMTAPSNEERDLWVDAIQTNVRAYSYSSEALTTACKELRSMLKAVNCTAPHHIIPSILVLLHQKQKALQRR